MKMLWIVPLLVVCAANDSFADKREVGLKAADGTVLKGTYYSTERSGPGVLLLHECKADHGAYDELGTMLGAAGYHVLAFDVRGVAGDIDTALAFLTSQTGVNPRALGIVASGCAVAHAVQASRKREEIRTLVLMSAGADAEGEAHIKAASAVPVLGIASEADAEGAAAVRALVGLSSSPYSHVMTARAPGRGAAMFAVEPELQADIVIWFRKNLAVGGYGLPPAIR